MPGKSSGASRAGRLLARCCIGAMLAVGCGGGAAPPAGEPSRYPEKKRPEPARSASDGEVLGANRQDPEDTLEASPTNEHPAAGWDHEDDGMPEEEAGGPARPRLPANPPAADTAAPLQPPDCVPRGAPASAEAARARADGRRPRPTCPIPPPP
jgi:hypothetical protein